MDLQATQMCISSYTLLLLLMLIYLELQWKLFCCSMALLSLMNCNHSNLCFYCFYADSLNIWMSWFGVTLVVAFDCFEIHIIVIIKWWCFDAAVSYQFILLPNFRGLEACCPHAAGCWMKQLLAYIREVCFLFNILWYFVFDWLGQSWFQMSERNTAEAQLAQNICNLTCLEL